LPGFQASPVIYSPSLARQRTRPYQGAGPRPLFGREDVGLPERTLWRPLYETAARAGEVLLLLDVDELDLVN
jgi:hypothetical protein